MADTDGINTVITSFARRQSQQGLKIAKGQLFRPRRGAPSSIIPADGLVQFRAVTEGFLLTKLRALRAFDLFSRRHARDEIREHSISEKHQRYTQA